MLRSKDLFLLRSITAVHSLQLKQFSLRHLLFCIRTMFRSPKRVVVLSPRAAVLIVAACASFGTPVERARGRTFFLTSGSTTTPTTSTKSGAPKPRDAVAASLASGRETLDSLTGRETWGLNGLRFSSSREKHGALDVPAATTTPTTPTATTPTGPDTGDTVIPLPALAPPPEEETEAARRAAFVDKHFSKSASQLRRRRRRRKMGVQAAARSRSILCAIWGLANFVAVLAWVASIGGALYVADRMYKSGTACALVRDGKCYMAFTEEHGDFVVHQNPSGDPVPFPVLYQNTVDWNLAGTIAMTVAFLCTGGGKPKPQEGDRDRAQGAMAACVIVVGAVVGFWCKIFAVDRHIMAKENCPDWVTELCTWDMWMTAANWVLFPIAFAIMQMFFSFLFSVHETLLQDAPGAHDALADEQIGAPWEHRVQVLFLDGEKRDLKIEKYWRKNVTAADVKAALLQEYRQELAGKRVLGAEDADEEREPSSPRGRRRAGTDPASKPQTVPWFGRQKPKTDPATKTTSGNRLTDEDEERAKDMVERTVLFMSNAGEDELQGDAIVSEAPRVKPGVRIINQQEAGPAGSAGAGRCAQIESWCKAGRFLPPLVRFPLPCQHGRRPRAQAGGNQVRSEDALERGVVEGVVVGEVRSEDVVAGGEKEAVVFALMKAPEAVFYQGAIVVWKESGNLMGTLLEQVEMRDGRPGWRVQPPDGKAFKAAEEKMAVGQEVA